MKPAIRLEISKKDDKVLQEKVDKIIYALKKLHDFDLDSSHNLLLTDYELTIQELITYHRTCLHSAFKMGMTFNPTTTENVQP